MKRDLAFIIKAALCVLVIDACGGTLGGNPERTLQNKPPVTTTPPPPLPSSVTFSLTDAPIENAHKVYITVESVQIAKADNSWITIPLEADEEIDLLSLQDGKSEVLAALDDLPAGTYGQTRLILAADSPGRLIDKDDVEHELVIPSGSEGGLKIQTSFTKVDGIALELTIDFDLRKSIKASSGTDNSGKSSKGKYMLQPVLRLTDDSQTGGTSGEAADGSVVCVYTNDAIKDASDDCEGAITSATVKDGKYKIAFLDPGVYDLRIFMNGTMVKDVEDQVVTTDKKDSEKDKDEEDDD